MKPAAIVSLLWPRYQQVLLRFAEREPGLVILTPEQYYSAALAETVAALGAKLLPLESLLDEAAGQRVHDGVNSALNKLAGYFDATGWEDQLQALQLDEDRLRPLLKARAEADVPGMIQQIELLRLAHDQFDVRLLVVSEDITAGCKTAVIHAKSVGVPSLQLMHGVALSKPYTVHGSLFADSLAVYGQRGLESYLDIGVEAQRCHITGNPAWDVYANGPAGRAAARERLAASEGLDPAKPWMLFATTWAANLTAIGDPQAFETTLRPFLEAARQLVEAGIEAQFIVKDRPGSGAEPEAVVRRLAAQVGLPDAYLHYASHQPEDWVRAVDAVVGADSNMQVEAMLAGTPVVNLMNWFGLRLGPSFDADCGVVEATPGELPGILAHLASTPATREHLSQKVLAASGRYNAGNDGQAAVRVAELMRQLMKKQATTRYLWQEFLDVEHIDATSYHDGRRPDLVEMFTNQPKLFLDIGCAAGGTGLAFKQKYPDAKAWGIEINEAAAAKAATRLDKVLCGKFEDFDLITEGIEPGTLDAVIIADVLEHMYNPWDVLTKLKPLLSPKGQIVTSIPNTRNAGLMEDLARGYWRYDSWGLLDITHIRFFTYKEIKRFFHETGYHIVKAQNGIDPRLRALYDLFRDKVPCDIDCGKMVLKNVTAEELAELCSIQFYTMVEQGSEALADYNPAGAAAVADPGAQYQGFLQSHLLTLQEVAHFENRLRSWPKLPLVHAVIVATADSVGVLNQTIGSLANQIYTGTRITVLSQTEPPEAFQPGPSLEWVVLDGSVNAAINKVARASNTDWITVLQSGDELAPHALLLMLEAAYSHSDWRLLYCDEDQQEAVGRYCNPHFKTDFQPDYFYALPFIGDFFMVRRDAFDRLGGYPEDMVGASNFDFVLRLQEVFGDASIGHVPDVLYHRATLRSLDLLPTNETLSAGQLALADSLKRRGIAARVESGRLPGTYRIRYQHAATPRVSLILLTRENLPQLQRCLEGLLLNTEWPDYELLIVDLGTRDTTTLQYLHGLDEMGDERIRVFRIQGAQNLAQVRNQAAAEATGGYLLFIDSNTVPTQGHWLQEMMSEAQRPEIGVVGPRILSPDGLVKDAGRLLGFDGVASSPFVGLRFDESGYYGRLQTPQNYSAVGSACLLVRRTVFQQVGGFDTSFDLSHADHDLCLRVREAGYRLLWTPYASLVCEGGGGSLVELDEALLVERQETNQTFMFQRWLPHLATDPAYNRNLALHTQAFSIDPRPHLTKRALEWKPVPRLLSLPGDNWGCGNYRVIQPERAAVKAGRIEGWHAFDHYLMSEIGRINPDTIVLQRQMLEGHLPYLRAYQQQQNIRLVFESDDLMTAVPKKSLHRADLPRGIQDKLRRALQYCDRFIVSTEPLKEAMTGLHHDIRVVKNSLDAQVWGELKPRRRIGKKPRVGWAGGVSHGGDLEVIYEVVKQLADEVEWVFFGMAPDPIKDYIHDIRPGVAFDQYAASLAALDLDLGIAPLEYNAFNECKSNLRVLEYGILGFPMIATDFTPYQGDYPITLVDNRTESWVKAIREHINDLDESARKGDALREYVLKHWMLEDRIDEWMDAWFNFQ